jgi:hypothetical protein
MKAHGWRQVKVNPMDKTVAIKDAAGKKVSIDRLAKLLEKEIPVIVSNNGPVDPFHLLTVKDGTLAFEVPTEILYGTPKPGK